jgi:hypothetical protein
MIHAKSITTMREQYPTFDTFPTPSILIGDDWSLPLKQDLPFDITFYITFDPPHFSLYNTFKLLANRILGTDVFISYRGIYRINMLFLEESSKSLRTVMFLLKKTGTKARSRTR